MALHLAKALGQALQLEESPNLDHDLTLDTTFSEKPTGDQGGDGVFGEFLGLS